VSASIDERIVQMQFDNAQFESKARTTMSTLDKLRAKLNFTKSTAELSNIADDLNNVNFGNIEKAANNVNSCFTFLGRTINTELDRIVNKAVDTGNKVSSALTIDPLKDGLEEYKTQMDAIQTILANTKSKGTTIDDVTAALDELNTYADQTIYNFSQMTKNIGTFTAAGVGLKTSVASIKGIANLAAVSGSSAQQASTAMYQLSQAIAAGTVKLQDWNSVVNANMGGEVFQKALERTARVMGTGVDAALAKVNGSFRESLSKGWLTSDVLTETLAQISGAYDDAALAAKGYTEEQIKEIQDLAETAKSAATEIKTLPQLIDVAKEALGSGWTKSFEYIFGNFEQAKKIFTSIGNTMQKFIDISSDARNSVLKDWSDMGGRDQMVTGLANAFWSLYAVVASVKKAFTDIFPAVTGKTLFDLTKKFREFTTHLMISKSTSEAITNTFRGLFALLKAGINIIGALAKALSPVAKVLLILGNAAISALGCIGNLVAEFINWVDEAGLVRLAMTAVYNGVLLFLAGIGKAIAGVASFVKSVANLPVVQKAFEKISNAVSTLYSVGVPALSSFVSSLRNFIVAAKDFAAANLPNVLQWIYDKFVIVQSIAGTVGSVVARLAKKFISFAKNLTTVPNKIRYITESIREFAKEVTDKIMNGKIGDYLKNAKDALNDFKDNIVEFVNTTMSKLGELDPKAILAFAFGVGLVSLVLNLSKLVKTANGLVDNLSSTVSSGNTVLKTLNKTVESFKKSKITQVATAILAFAGALWVLKDIPPVQLAASAGAISAIALAMTLMTTAIGALGKMGKIGDATKYAYSMVALGGAIFLMCEAFNSLNDMKIDESLGAKLVVMGTAIAGIAAGSIALAKWAPALSKGSVFLLAFSLSISNVINAINKLNVKDLGDVSDAMSVLISVVGLMSVLAVAASRVKFGNATGLLALVASMYLMENLLKKIAENGISWETVKANIDKYAMVLTAMAALVVLARTAAGVAAGLGVAAAGIGAGVLLIAQSLNKFENFKPEGPVGTIELLATIGGVFAAVIWASKYAQGGMTAASVVVAAAAGVWLIATAVEKFTKIDPKSLSNAVAEMSALLIEIGLMATALIVATQYTKDAKIGPLIAMIGMLGVLVSSMAVLSTMIDSTALLKTGVSLGLALAGIGAAFAGLGSMKNQNVKSIALLAEMIVVLASTAGSLYIVAQLPLDGVVTAATCIAAILAVLAGAVNWAQDAVSGAKALALATVPLVGAAGSLWVVAQLPLDGVKIAAVALVSIVAVLAGACKLAKDCITGAGSIAIASLSLLPAAASLMLLANYDWDGISNAALILIAVMGSVVIASNLATGALVGAAAMVVLSASLIVIAAALRIVGGLPSDQISAAANALVEVLVALTIAGAIAGVFAPVAAGMIAVAAAFAVFGVGVAAFGVGAVLLATAVDIFVDAMVKLSQIGPEEAENIKNSMAQIGLGIGEGLANVVVGFAQTILQAISDAIGSVIEWLGGKVSDFTEQGGKLLEGLGLGFLTKPDGVSSAVSECIEWVGSLFDGLKDTLKTAGQNALAGLQEGIQSFKDGGFSGLGKWAGGKVLEGFNKITGHHSPWKTMITAGKDMVRGLEKGIDKGDIGGAAEDSADTFIGNLRTVWGWHSPWDTLIQAGKDAISGLSKGVSEGWNTLKSSFSSIGENVTNSLSAPLSNLQKAFSDSFGMGADSSIISAVTDLFPGLTDMLNSTSDATSALGLDADDLASSLGSVGSAADSAGSSVGSAGSAASAASSATSTATQNLEQNAKFLKYSAKVVQAYTKQYGKMNDTVGDTSSVKEATEAITLLATKIYDSEQAYKQTTTTAEEAQTRIDGIKKSFVSLYESIQSGLESSLKANEEFDYKFGTTTKSMLSNISSQITGFNDYSTAITEMLQRGFDADAIKEYVDSGVSSIGEISALLMMSRSEINKWNSDYKKLTDIKENGADGLVATIAKATMQANVDIEKSSKEAHDTILKYAEDTSYKIIDTSNDTQVAAADSSKAIVASADIAKEAYNDTAQLAYVVLDANGKVAESFYEIGEQATEQSHVVETAYKAIQQSIEDTLESQRKFFEEFDTGEDDEDAKTAEDYLDMMQSQIDGTRQWSEMLENISNTLGDTSGAKEFVEYLASLGTDGYKYVKAFNDASEDELESAVHRYAEIMQLSGTQSEQIAGTFRDNGYYSVSEWSGAVTSSASSASEELVVTADAAGENFGLGYVNGMQSTVEAAKAQANTLGLESLNSLQTALQEHSPSKATEEMGTNLGAGLQNGINSSTVGCINTSQTLANTILIRFQMDLDKSKFEDIGKNAIQGLIDGMQDSTLLGKAIQTATDLATKAYNAAKEALDINSPSKKFRSLGKSAVEGFSQGFRRYSAMSTKAAEDVSNDALSAVSDVIEAMNIASDDGLDIQPTITPVVDMSNVSAASGMLNGYFGQVPMNVSSYLNSSTISDALAAISQNAAGSTDVVSAIKELRSDVQYLGQAIGQAKVTLDTGVIAGAVTPGVSARINKQVSSRGSVWK
jgi:tape measure domain-containing protein